MCDQLCLLRDGHETCSALMDIAIPHRLSFKQARLIVLIGFCIGTLLSLVQIGIDYASENASIDREIRALLQITHNPASRIAYNIDAELAQELTAGLLHSTAVVGARLSDNNQVMLAASSRPMANSSYRMLSDSLFGDSREFQDLLYLDHAPSEAIGTLFLDVDTYAFGSRFLERAEITLLNGFVRSLVLACVLMGLLYFTLTKPLTGVIRALAKRDSSSPQQIPLRCPKGHEKDEIGVLVQVTNQQFENVAGEFGRRLAAENRLNDHLNELENVVWARTRELEASNTRLSQSNEELEVARRTALDMANARSAFLAHMSHEIRTPLNGVLGMLALSLDGPLSAEQRQQLSIAHDSGKVLVELLNDILDLSKFDAGQLELERIPFDLATLVEDTANLLSQNAAASVELTCLIDPRFPGMVLGDPTRVRQIVSNLLSNALKFTRVGRVDIRLSEHLGLINIEVRDTGIGIAQDAQAKIFQPFTQAEAAITRQYGGTGLGLTLTHNLCGAMKGELNIESTPGVGSRFCARLPLPPHAPAPAWPTLKGRVLVASDANSGLSELMALLLPEWGIDYRQLSPEDSKPLTQLDLLITDRPECLAGVRPATHAPVLLVTAYGNFMPGEQVKALAPLQQQARPLSRTVLHQTLKNLLQTEPQPPGEAVSGLSPRPHRARILLVEDNPVNQLVAKGMLSKLGCDVVISSHGGEALLQLEHGRFDLVLMDCNMPVLDGYEATRLIRQSGKWPNLPIIALTANAMPEERERCKNAGMNDYLAKPFHREELVALLEQWVSLGARDV